MTNQSTTPRSRPVHAAHLALWLTYTATAFWCLRLSDGLATGGRRVASDRERGEVSSTTVMIAILVGLAVVVGGIITAKITQRANSIPG